MELEKHLGLITSIAKQFENSYTEREDLIQEGLIALSCALNSYEERKNSTLLTYLYRCIKNKMLSYAAKQNRLNLCFTGEPERVDAYMAERVEDKVVILDQVEKLSEKELEVFYDYFIGKGISRAELAKQKGVSTQRISKLINNITAKMDL